LSSASAVSSDLKSNPQARYLAVVAILLGFLGLSIFALILQAENAEQAERITDLEVRTQLLESSSSQSAVPISTPTLVDPNKTRLETNYRLGVYDAETVEFVVLEIHSQLGEYPRNSNSDPYRLSVYAYELGAKFDYLAIGIERGLVDKSSAERLVAEYETATLDPYSPKVENGSGGGKYLRLAISKVTLAKVPTVD